MNPRGKTPGAAQELAPRLKRLIVATLRLEGLDPHRSYQVRPLVPGIPVGSFPGLMAPPWFGEARGSSFDGGTYGGAFLGTVGLQSPFLIPDYPLLFLVREA